MKSIGNPDDILARTAALMRRVAEAEIMPRFRKLGPGDVREKGPGDWVTVADEAAERALRIGLTRLLPGSVTVGEEEVAADASVLDRLAGSEPAWIIDPVDGTRLFRKGVAGFGMIVALSVGGRTIMGWILDCMAGHLACAASGAGAFGAADGAMRALSRPEFGMPTVGTASRLVLGLTSGGPDPQDGGRASVRALPSLCSASDYLAIARGESAFNIAIQTKPWDHAAGALIVSELGGTALRFNGTPYSATRDGYGIVVAADAAIAASAIAMFVPADRRGG